ncbi:MAG: hypothetical protein ACI4R6_01490 [Lachnospiraceae bacterium]
MPELSDLELQNLRHLIMGCDLCSAKLTEYASCATDTKIKDFFEKGADSAKKNKEELVKFLG